MKLSDYIADFLARQGIRHVFAISGGASLHLIHSIAEHPGIDFVCPQHEQAGAMAADAYTRVSGNFGVAMATSGPGATNLITGICCSYYDSVPTLFITGQVATFRFKGDTGVRQMGFQETDTVQMCQYITKYSVMVTDPRRIRYELEKACYLARAGRPGPVLVDVPDDLQRGQVDPVGLEGFSPPPMEVAAGSPGPTEEQVRSCLELLKEASRPVLALGWGIHLAKAEKSVRELIDRLGIPVVMTWAAADVMPHDHPMAVGTWGTHGTRAPNFTIQNADFVLTIGTRLDTKATGSPPSSFARGAKLVVVDIDPAELNKLERFGVRTSLTIASEAGRFVRALLDRRPPGKGASIGPWLERVQDWKRRYPACLPAYYQERDVNPYVFVKTLSERLGSSATIMVDTGCAIAWMMQGFEFKEGQRLYHDFNNTAMGWALPAAIGASLALGKAEVVCVAGDGALQMNIQELVTVLRHDLPIKLFLLNNHGHSMVQQTQEQWLGAKYYATSVEGGLAFPDFAKVAEAYGFEVHTVSRNDELKETIGRVMSRPGPVFCNVEIKPEHRVIPQVRFGRMLEDSEPFLDRKEFLSNMIVPPHPSSLT